MANIRSRLQYWARPKIEPNIESKFAVLGEYEGFAASVVNYQQ